MSRSHKKSHKRNNESSSLGKKKEKSKKNHKKHSNHKNEHRKHQSKKSKKKNKLSKRKKETIKKKLLVKKMYMIISAFLISFILYIGVFFFMFSVGKMDGYSMIPTLNNKEVVAVNRRKNIARFDLIYMNTPNGKGKSVRRVIGIPGDEISFKDDELFINGNGKEEKYLIGKKRSLGSMILTDDFTLDEVTGQTKVPNDAYFVLGDNRKSSTDSRYYGFVSKKDVIGRVDLRLFPLSKFKVF
ncbi:signal peptidase I [Vagococcus carniphilus]|uniref:signal peptidase I n=1 Tax=Vagococcus carniphilus TaxID=218144 RepID=UPI003BAA21E4